MVSVRLISLVAVVAVTVGFAEARPTGNRSSKAKTSKSTKTNSILPVGITSKQVAGLYGGTMGTNSAIFLSFGSFCDCDLD
ncbi:hypothetical protein H4R33_002289 [Dimargaris cristalligena]|uniref:Uncharacterized protein n=1 Tax=Dimargaris cristalligena TaxID=215637 RepID=A0A4Q0A2L6_9FUNG|nr:hypothetical protein H4R33_002289 [Dimargaris cristalligena]RKP40376.1 hypothetical protein BJ085DRAFT_37671 [Dimargaris cristalligena]|eukprot:RKP40376.1 hypothetical protein BJ085DRAFT_37671 [Dimargaris cristalligena]